MRAFFFLALLCIGCNDDPTCIPEQSNQLNLLFISKFGEEKMIEFTEFLIEDKTILRDSSFTTIAIPLNPNDSILALSFHQLDGIKRITIHYKTTPIILDIECALDVRFDHLEVDTTNFIDAKIINPLLSLESLKNVEITH